MFLSRLFTTIAMFVDNVDSYVNGTRNWNKDGSLFKLVGVLAPGNNATFNIIFNTTQVGTWTNVVVAGSNITENKTAENDTTVLGPDMSVQKITLNKTVFVGENVSFVVVVTNTGDCDLTNVVVTDFFKSEELELVGFVDKSGKWTNSSNVFTYNGNLAVGGSANFTVIFKTLVNGTLINTVNATSKETGNRTANNNTTVYSTIINVTKVWNDSDNQDGKRPISVTVILLADGKEVNRTFLFHWFAGL